jgi:Domain of unknown function (DUF2019)
MKRPNVVAMTLEDLVDRFAAIGLDQDKAIFDEDNAKYNKLYDQIQAIVKELKCSPGDQRRALLPLFAHRNVQVRLMAALETLDIATPAAREVLQGIVNCRRYPQAADALAAIWRLDGKPIARH